VAAVTFTAGVLVGVLAGWLYVRWCRQREIVIDWDPEEDE
jgi:hypothetical protein